MTKVLMIRQERWGWEPEPAFADAVGENICDIPDDLWARYQAAEAEFEAAQREVILVSGIREREDRRQAAYPWRPT